MFGRKCNSKYSRSASRRVAGRHVVSRSPRNQVPSLPRGSALYRGEQATDKELANRDEGRPLILLDDAMSKATGEKFLIATWIPTEGRKDFRMISERHPRTTKDGHEAKYRNTGAKERENLFVDLNKAVFEISDTYDYRNPSDFEKKMPFAHRKNLDRRALGYIYQTDLVIREILSRHPGRIDIAMDNPPYDIWDELMQLCGALIAEGYQITWYIVTPSGTMQELWIHDYLAGLDRDILEDEIEDNPQMHTQDKNGNQKPMTDALRNSIDGIAKRRVANPDYKGVERKQTPKTDDDKRPKNANKGKKARR